MRGIIAVCIALIVWALVAAAAVMFTSCGAHAEPLQEWQAGDKALFITAEALLLADCGYTLDIKRQGGHDMNPLIENNNQDFVKGYFAAWIIGLYFFCEAYPQYRTTALVLINSVEIYAIDNNIKCGYSISF